MFEEMYHSDSARAILDKYFIGTLKQDDAATSSAVAADDKSKQPQMHIGTAVSSSVNMSHEQFENFTLSKITKVSHDTCIFKFALPAQEKLKLPIGHHIQIWYVHFVLQLC